MDSQRRLLCKSPIAMDGLASDIKTFCFLGRMRWTQNSHASSRTRWRPATKAGSTIRWPGCTDKSTSWKILWWRTLRMWLQEESDWSCLWTNPRIFGTMWVELAGCQRKSRWPSVFQAVSFRQTSRTLARTLFWRNMRMYFVVGLLLLFVVYIVTSSFCGGLTWSTCR